MNTTAHVGGGLLGRANRARIEWVSLCLALGASCLVSACFFANDRMIAHAAETARLENQARIIDENLRHQLEGARGALENVRSALRQGRRFGTADLETVRNAMPGVRALAIVDARTGVAASGKGAAMPVHVLRSLLAANGGASRLSLTPFGGGPGKPSDGIVLSLRADAANGHGAVLVAATLDASYFDVVMRSVLYAADMRTAIFDNHAGALLYAPPDAARPGIAFPARALETAMQDHRSESVLRAASREDAEERILVYRRVDPASLALAAPLGIGVSRSVAAIDAPWRRVAIVYFSAWCFVAALAACVLLVVQRRRRLLEQNADERAAERQRHATRIELALAGADLGLWDWHLPSGRRTLNERGAAMLGYTPEQLDTVAVFYRMVHPDDADTVRRVLQAHLDGATPGYDAEFRMQHCRNGWVWVHCRGRIVERGADGTPLRIIGTRMDITERKASERQIHQLAYYDGLTMLPNRRLLLQRLEHALAMSGVRKRHGALLFLDLDQFKQLNDTLGHDMGDKLLRSVARRLQDVVRCDDTVARFGGDEFVVLLQDVGDCRAAACQAVDVIGRNILRRLAEPHALEGRAYRSTSSIGATLFADDAQGVDAILKQADLAMYQAKAEGRATLRFFDPGMQRRALEAVTMEEDLRAALLLEQFVLHYQPIVDATGHICGVEALVRWTHPGRGAMRPDEFIAVAEKTGLILPLGHWVLEQACALLARWSGAKETAQRTVAVNVSVRQFRHPDFVSGVMSVLARTGAPAGRLKLELTESMLLDDVDGVRAKMEALRACGITFSLDDFGTGYSSLGYLKKLPLSQLKIDRSFVQDVLVDPNDAAIARTIIALAHSLALEVVAEGVETRPQFEFLSASGCAFFQGYLFGRPAPLAS